MSPTHNPTELDPLVDQFQHLSDKGRAAEALQMLRKVASMVKPVMRTRGWRVGVLTEFYPPEANLLGLNINRGEKICLRLRYPGDDSQFLPMENIVDTMLHELAHIVHGPHNQEFNALWDQLRDEHEALVRKGYTGEGFLGKGSRLGGRRIPLSEARRLARVAAESRRARNIENSPRRLGGQGIERWQDAREVIAAAAEKRIRIERGCASDTEKGRIIAREEANNKDIITTKAEQEDENDAALMQAFIDLIQEEEAQRFGDGYVPPSQTNPAGVRGTTLSTSGNRMALKEQQMQIERQLLGSRARDEQSTASKETKPALLIDLETDYPDPEPRQGPETWTCEICTLINPIQRLTCDACEEERPEIYSPPAAPPARPSRPASSNSNANAKTNANKDSKTTHTMFQPRLSAADARARIEAQAANKRPERMGWTCSCGNWMENMWWTCANCGRMKASS